MLRATRIVRAEDDTVVEPAPIPDIVHDAQLEATLHRLVAPPPAPPRPATRPPADRAVFGLD